MLKETKQFLLYLQDEMKLSVSTIKSYKEALESVIEYMYELFDERVPAPSEITVNHLRGYLAAMQEAEYKPSTVAKHLTALRSFYKFALLVGLVEANPAILISFPKPQRRRLPYVLSIKEVDMLLDAPPTDNHVGIRDRAVLETMYCTGILVSELVGMNLGDLNLDEGYVQVRMKEKQMRLVPLISSAVRTIRTWLEYHKKILEDKVNSQEQKQTVSKRSKAKNKFTAIFAHETPLFLNTLGGRITTRSIGRMIKKYVEQTQLDFRTTPHTLRHTIAVHLLIGGADVQEVQEILGHQCISSMQTYTRLMSMETMTNAMNLIKNYSRTAE